MVPYRRMFGGPASAQTQFGLTDHEDVTAPQPRPLDEAPVEQRAVARTEIADEALPRAHGDLGVAARDRVVAVEEDVTTRSPPEHPPAAIGQRPFARVRD